MDGDNFRARWLHIDRGVLTSKKIYRGQDSEVGFHFEEGVSVLVSEISYRWRGLHFEVGV
ncbi:hypothetical protein [Halorubrum sp. AS12]|uniref:hypothetical protein n=1 Tax=Halorubrum sp. AS12 TaxID=3409687 RepID=UPI003DA6F4AC